MAHFCNDRNERISGQIIPLRHGSRRTILLWGGAVNGRPLNVFSTDSNVIQIQEETQSRGANPQIRRFQVTARQNVDNVRIHVSPSNNAAEAWDTITFIVNTAEEQNRYNRERVIALARSLNGSHYLEGAAGAMPDQLNGMPGRPGFVYMLSPETVGGNHPRDPRDIQSSVACTDIKAFHSCAGRPWWPNGNNNPPFVEGPDRLDMSREDNLHSYRTVYMNRREQSRTIVRRLGIILGERCEGKRHFDCVGFISYCLSMTLGYGHQMEISGEARYDYRSYANNFRKIEATDEYPDLPGDILIFGGAEREFIDRRGNQRMVIDGAHHIAFSLGDGRQMIHAADTQWGVTISSIGRDLTRRVRHPRLG